MAGIALYDTGNEEGTWVVYNIDTRSTVCRNKLVILPMPDIVIELLNKMADRQNEQWTGDFAIRTRGNIIDDEN